MISQGKKGGAMFSKPAVYRILYLTLIGLIMFLMFKHVIQPQQLRDVNIEVKLEDVMKGKPVQLAQDDPRIRKYIQDHGFIQPPSKLEYNLEKPDKDPSMGQGQLARKILGEMRDGFFVECGALDGETRSNSLYMEKELGWKGLLIEADPKNYQMVLSKNRKAWSSNSCLATQPIPHEVVFRQQFNVGKITDIEPTDVENRNGLVRMQCFPLYSLLNAIEVRTVDYFSLDVEGNELDVLLNVPFDKIFIKVLSVEFSHVAAGKAPLKEFMEGKGYIVAGEVTNKQGLANDYIFVHQSLKHLIPDENES